MSPVGAGRRSHWPDATCRGSEPSSTGAPTSPEFAGENIRDARHLPSGRRRVLPAAAVYSAECTLTVRVKFLRTVRVVRFDDGRHPSFRQSASGLPDGFPLAVPRSQRESPSHGPPPRRHAGPPARSSVTGLVTTGKRTPPLGAVLTLVDVEGKQVGQTTSAADCSCLLICGAPSGGRKPQASWVSLDGERAQHRSC